MLIKSDYLHHDLGSFAYRLIVAPQCAPGVPSGRPAVTTRLLLPLSAEVPISIAALHGNAGVQYSVPMGGKATPTPRLNYAYVGRQFTNLFHSPTLDLLRFRRLLSALLTYSHGDWRIEGFANNMANKDYVAGQIGNNEVYGAPREFGVRQR